MSTPEEDLALAAARECAWAQAALPILKHRFGLAGPPQPEDYEMLRRLACSLSFDPREKETD